MREEAPEPEPGGRRPVFHPRFVEHGKFWMRTAPAVARRLDRLVAEILRSPFTGIGKPEPLQYQLHGFWARRLTRADRVIYEVTDETVEFYSARYHYPPGLL